MFRNVQSNTKQIYNYTFLEHIFGLYYNLVRSTSSHNRQALDSFDYTDDLSCPMSRFEDYIHRNSILRSRLNHLLWVQRIVDHVNVVLSNVADNGLPQHYHIFLLNMQPLHETLAIVGNMFEDYECKQIIISLSSVKAELSLTYRSHSHHDICIQLLLVDKRPELRTFSKKKETYFLQGHTRRPTSLLCIFICRRIRPRRTSLCRLPP